MSKKKTIAYLIAGSLLIGGTFIGTKAWFTDGGTADNSLIVTMGSFNLDIIENKDVKEQPTGWVLHRNGKPESIKTEANGHNFTNVKPGDQFIRTVTFKNSGTLNQRVTLDLSNFKGEVPSGFMFNTNMGGFPGGVIGSTYKDIPGGGEETIKMSIKVTKDMLNEGFSGETFNMNLGNIEVSSKQINEGLASEIDITKK